MASSLPESWGCIDMDVNDSNMSNALIMSLWEETQADQEHDEERLSSLIRALEVELDPTTTGGHHHQMYMDANNAKFGCSNSADNFQQSSDRRYVNGGSDCSASGFSWMEMELEIGSCSKGDEQLIDNWYLDDCAFDEIDCMSSNFGGGQTTAPLEQHGHQNVWQEACDTSMLV